MTERNILLRFSVKKEGRIIRVSAMRQTTYESNDDIKWIVQKTYGAPQPALLDLLKLKSFEVPVDHQLDPTLQLIDTQIVFDEPPFQIWSRFWTARKSQSRPNHPSHPRGASVR